MRRTTAYEPPAIQACSAGPGPAPGTKMRLSKSGSEGFGLPVPSTWPIRLRAVIGVPVAPGDRLKPFICQRTRAASPASFCRARRAWKATRPSSAPIWTHRSPLLRWASSRSEEKSGSGSRAVGRRAVRPVRSKKEWPKPKVTVREDGPASRAIPLSEVDAGSPAISRRAVSDQRRSSAAASVRPAPAVRSKATRCPLACSGVVMPAWWSPWKATWVAPREARLPAAPGAEPLPEPSSAECARAPPAAPRAIPTAPAAPTVPSSLRREISMSGLLSVTLVSRSSRSSGRWSGRCRRYGRSRRYAIHRRAAAGPRMRSSVRGPPARGRAAGGRCPSREG